MSIVIIITTLSAVIALGLFLGLLAGEKRDLGMNLRISVYFGRRCEQQLGLHLNGQLQHVIGTRNARLQRLHRIELVVNGGCGACEVKDLIARNVLLVSNVSAHHLKVWEVQQVPGGSE